MSLPQILLLLMLGCVGLHLQSFVGRCARGRSPCLTLCLDSLDPSSLNCTVALRDSYLASQHTVISLKYLHPGGHELHDRDTEGSLLEKTSDVRSAEPFAKQFKIFPGHHLASKQSTHLQPPTRTNQQPDA
jgi:hypothetical protein